MSLRRRIAAAAAVAVAAVAVAVAVIGYVSTRSHLIGEVKNELRAQAGHFLAPHGPPNGPPIGNGQPGGLPGFHVPGPPEPGGAAGIVQIVGPDGTVFHGAGLPVTRRLMSIAHNGSSGFFSDPHVHGIHYEVYTVWDAPDQHVVEIAQPLTSQESVLGGLLLPYGLLIGGGVLLALLLGAAISTTALAPIERFLRRTEDVTRELERPRRLEETGASELRRLASSFNQTLDALERSTLAQRHLVADASHELRTPMAALRSNIQIFLEAHRLPEHERAGLQESILAELDELTQVVADVVELARGSAPSLHSEPLELDTIVRDAVARTQRRARGLHFDLDLEPTLIDGISERVSRAVTNLIDNAAKWSLPDGTVELALHGGTLTVRDHGPGFAESDLPNVFARFYRAENARRLPGSGLGLAIVKQAAEAHGGTVHAGNAPGGGALISVSFGGEQLSSGPTPG